MSEASEEATVAVKIIIKNVSTFSILQYITIIHDKSAYVLPGSWAEIRYLYDRSTTSFQLNSKFADSGTWTNLIVKYDK